uniref:CSD domain-containing protein n=1 Tax=Alexandrium andersonii TaxID=327968 RepID=A0A7S2J857_9DINO|mmetsp:Transcript_95984/g.214999  ORF Transcript_95984/g.214999 Transcript_95984/m.214999 type:complete len:206 (+) Transcript_95984:51-668(+)
MAQSGKVKSFNPSKGWGFIELDGIDVFVHQKFCTDGVPVVGDAVTFDLEQDEKTQVGHKAVNVSGCTGKKPGAAGTGANSGVVKSFNHAKGWGFIEMEGSDIFLHVKDVVQKETSPQVGDKVTFDVEEGKNGSLKASNVSGCTGRSNKGKGKGGYGAMWGGYDGYGGYGGFDPYGGKGWGGYCDPYGGYGGYGCGGKGYGKGKGW